MHTRFSARFAARVLIVGFGAICAASVATIAAAASEGPSTSSNSATSSQATVPSSTSGIPGIPDATAATAASAPTPHAVATGGTAAPQASVSVLLKNKRGDSHFKPGQSVEDVAARTEKAKQFINADGTTSEVLSTRPLHFKDFAGRWVDIDPTVEPDPAGGFQSTANAWQAHFSALPAGVTIDTAGGKVRFSPAGSASVAPQVLPDGQGVVYPDAWPGVDLRYRVEPDGVKEELVLKTRTVATTFAFDTKGLSYDPTPDGGLIASHGANTVGSIAPPELQDAQGTPQPDAHPALSATSKGNKSLVTVTVDPAFMTEAPDSAFPLVLDPSYNATLSNNANYKSDGYSCSWCGVRVGNSRDLIGGVSYDRYWRNVTYFDYAGIPGTPHINGATIDLTNLQGGTQNGYTISAYWASAYSYAGALSGGVLASVSGTDTYYATLSSPTLTAYYDWWVHSHIVGSALGFVGQEQSGLYTYKQFGTATLTLSWYTALPSAPTSPSIVAQPNGNLEAHWNPSADDGGAPIDKYTVTLYPAGSTTPAGTYDCNNCGPGSYVWWYGLADGSSWYYTITAHNSVGTGPAATTPTATVYYLPGVPGNLQNYAGNGQALATWTAAPTNNGPAIDSYLVNAYDNTTSTSHFANACGTCTSYQFMGLTNGHSYTFAVQAHNHWGYAQSYATAPNAITPATNVGPYPPQYPSASPGNASAWIAWDTPIANNGAAVTDPDRAAQPGRRDRPQHLSVDADGADERAGVLLPDLSPQRQQLRLFR